MLYVGTRMSMTSFVTYFDALGWDEVRGVGPGHTGSRGGQLDFLDPPLRPTAWPYFEGSLWSLIWSPGAGIFACGRQRDALPTVSEKKWGVLTQTKEL